MDIQMFVTKRSGSKEELSFDKIVNRVRVLGYDANIHHINYQLLAIDIIKQLYDNISTSKIDELLAEQCAIMANKHPDYSILASRVVISNHQKNTSDSFFSSMEPLFNHYNINTNQHNPIISSDFYDFIKHNREVLDSFIVHDRDYLIDYFGFKTLERAYLLKYNNTIVERPQYMWLRVAIALHYKTIGKFSKSYVLERIKETYDLMSTKYFTHATPTLFNAGTNNPQMSSCFLVAMKEDSIDGIFDTLKECALISKWAGGIGLHVHNIRSKNSYIAGTNGTSNGLVPMLKVFNDTARYVDQGGNKRNGSFAIYLEPWHPDIFDFLDLKKNHGDENSKARDLFYGLWICDLFMKRVHSDSNWSLFCPNKCNGLADTFGDEFEQLYINYENLGYATKTIKARELWYAILDSQMETGTPYMLYKDHINKKSNQQNVGTIKSSNLCCEITEYSSSEETAVCNLASIALCSFVNTNTKQFDFNKLHEVTKIVTNNLNNVIDSNYYPTKSTKQSNLKHRPIGIGVQGLADTFFLMDYAFDSDEAKQLNKQIFETMYHAALEKSNELANIFGSYDTFNGSPASKGILQFDMWNVTPSDRYDWISLKEKIISSGLRNSLLIAPMPTASTSQILGFNECFEPITSNLYSRKTLAGEFMVVNKYLMKELISLNLWDSDMVKLITRDRGSIQSIPQIPQLIKDKYKTVWELKMKSLIDMSADRGAFICQSQSLNLWMAAPTYDKLTSMHFHAWNKGLKTGIYYLRRQPKTFAQQFTVDPHNTKQLTLHLSSPTTNNTQVSDNNEEGCVNCSA